VAAGRLVLKTAAGETMIDLAKVIACSPAASCRAATAGKLLVRERCGPMC